MASAYVVHSFPAPVVIVDRNEGAAYVVNTTVAIASAPVAQSTNTFTQGFFMVPSVALGFGLAQEIVKCLPSP